MKIKRYSLYGCLLLAMTSLHADCNKPISASDLPPFIAANQINGYLENAKQRQQTLCSQNKSLGQDKAIYVTDNRFDAYLATGAVREAAQSTAALIKKIYLQKQGNEFVINHNATLEKTGWCSTEPFANQPVTANCTAFLVEENTLVTAGHCLRNSQGQSISLDSYYVVFGYQMNNKNQAQTRFPASNVYTMIKEREVEKSATKDWAVVELDRKVTGKRIFEFESDEIAKGTSLTIFGYPNGLPLKIADGGIVKRNEHHKNVFDTDLDSYKGNSGSPVLNAAALKQGRFVVEGILVSGAIDSQPSGNCKVSITCGSAQLNNTNGHCSGEKVTKINRVIAIDTQATQTPNQLESLPDDFQRLLK